MQTTIPLYGFGGGGGTGATLTVSAPAGAVVTVSKDGKTKTKVAGADGVVVFKGLSTGDWTVNMTSAYGTETMQPKVYHITAGYEIVLTFFAATIHVTSGRLHLYRYRRRDHPDSPGYQRLLGLRSAQCGDMDCAHHGWGAKRCKNRDHYGKWED